ncbi:MAG TPA: DegT/DnrJ/EryC1/StrS family aminotransferase [Candidatus Binatia bacterium]|nr:DegT/DnrJ/EryC1/StrS family aminotransferase [Candidatus Binatia bacterium]
MEALARVGVGEERVALLDLTREYDAHRRELLAACERVLERMHLLGGEEVRAFESEFAAYLGVRHVRGVASGTDALWLALVAAGVGPGDEVLVQANAFMAAVEAIQRAGARPVATDIRLDDLGPDVDDLAAALTSRTRAVLVVHLHGLPVDVRPVLALARERDLVVVEDCSHAHGARLAGRRVGGWGVAGAFSLGVVKNLAAYGDAGVVSTDDAAIAERVKLLGTHGQAKKNEHAMYGTNSRLDELQAAMLRVKLRLLDARNRRRAEIAAHYDVRLRPLVVTPPADPARTHVYHQYVLRTPVRDALRAHLAAHEVETGVHYPVPIHRQPAWLRAYGETPALPRAEQAAREMLSLPVHADLGDAEVERVADAVVGFFRR